MIQSATFRRFWSSASNVMFIVFQGSKRRGAKVPRCNNSICSKIAANLGCLDCKFLPFEPFKSYFRNLRRFRRGNSFLMKFPANEEATGSNYTQCYVKAMLQNAMEPSVNGRVGGVKKEWVTQHSDVLICDWFLQNPQHFVFKHCLLIRKYRNGRRTKDGRRIERVNWLQRLTKIIATKNRSI